MPKVTVLVSQTPFQNEGLSVLLTPSYHLGEEGNVGKHLKDRTFTQYIQLPNSMAYATGYQGI